jgi:perosamine synthetase
VAVAALGIGAGDEVILPSFTIISCAAAIVRAGAIPVVVDADPVTWNMDVALVEAAITPRTKALMVVHIYGLPTDMEPVLALAVRHNLKIIEDCAEQIGQTYRMVNGEVRAIGSFGDIATFSFYPNKHVTTGEGGMLLADDPDLISRARGLRNLCFGEKDRFRHEELGWNFRMSNLQAAVGVAQLERIDEFVVKKREIGRWYCEELADCRDLEIPPAQTGYSQNIYWVFGLVLCDHVPCDSKDIMKALGERGIGTRPFFWPMHEQPVFQKMGLFTSAQCPVSERLARRGFYLPSGLSLTRDQAHQSARALLNCLSQLQGHKA